MPQDDIRPAEDSSSVAASSDRPSFACNRQTRKCNTRRCAGKTPRRIHEMAQSLNAAHQTRELQTLTAAAASRRMRRLVTKSS
jgi:hypothetical protein